MASEAITRFPPAETRRGPGRPPTHGLYSEKAKPLFEARAREVAAALMSLPHVAPTDEVMAIEVGRTLAIIEAIDGDLARRGILARGGAPRKLLTERRAHVRLLIELLREFGGSPRSRIELIAAAKTGTLGEALARIREGAAA